MVTVEQAVAMVDDDLPDGAWMAMLCELTEMDAGEVSAELARLSENGRKWLDNGRFVEPPKSSTPKQSHEPKENK